MKRILIFTLIMAALAGCGIKPDNFTFNPAHTGMSGTMRGIHVWSDQVVWISGSGGEITRTIDGGQSWARSVVEGAEDLDFRDIHVFSQDTALVMSIGPGLSSRIYQTVDGGLNWRPTYVNTDTLAFFDGFDFFDHQHGILIGDPVDQKPYLLKTSDGGLSWSRLDPSVMPELIEGEYAFAASGTSIDVNPDGQIWLATGGSVARVFFSPDFGHSWDVSSTEAIQGNPASGLFSIAAQSMGNVIAVGGNYRQMDLAGKNVVLPNTATGAWQVPEGASDVVFLECVKWINPQYLIATGPTGIFLSRNKGRQWSRLTGEGGHALDLDPQSRTGWVVGNRGKVSKFTW